MSSNQLVTEDSITHSTPEYFIAKCEFQWSSLMVSLYNWHYRRHCLAWNSFPSSSTVWRCIQYRGRHLSHWREKRWNWSRHSYFRNQFAQNWKHNVCPWKFLRNPAKRRSTLSTLAYLEEIKSSSLCFDNILDYSHLLGRSATRDAPVKQTWQSVCRLSWIENSVSNVDFCQSRNLGFGTLYKISCVLHKSHIKSDNFSCTCSVGKTD